MTRALVIAASVASAFASCVAATDHMMAEGQYMQGSSQEMSSSSSESMPTGTVVKAKGCTGTCETAAVQNNINIVNQPIIIIATAAGGAAPTVTMNAAIQPPAATHTVTVGGDAGLVYSPEFIGAAMHDMVLFNFMAKNHTLTQSTFPKPCNKMMGGIDSGFMPNDGKGTPPSMMLQVNSAEPIWFYCRQKKPMPHCGAGMTFSINPTGEKSQAAFKAQAIALNGTGAAAGAMPTAGSMPADAAAAAAPEATMMPMEAAPVTTMAMPADAAASMPAEVPTDAQQNNGATGTTGAMDAGMIVQGTGQTDAGGSCSCSCMCGTQAFPADSGLGLGMAGGLPAQIAAVVPGAAYKAY